MGLIPLDPDEKNPRRSSPKKTCKLTGIEVSGTNREQILQALELNRQMLYEPQPGAQVDEDSVQACIDRLLEKLDARRQD